MARLVRRVVGEPIAVPDAAIDDYRLVWRAYNRRMWAEVKGRILPLLRRALRADASAGPAVREVRSDAAADEAAEEFGRIRELLGLGPLFDRAAADLLVSRFVVQVVDFHAVEFGQMVKKAIAVVDPFVAEPWLEEHLAAVVHHEAARWKRLPEEQIDKFSSMFMRALRDGRRAADVAVEMAASFEQYAKSADFLAKDQMLKVFGEVNDQRMIDRGIEKAQWSTALDEHVRPTHAELQGHEYNIEVGAKIPSSGKVIKPGREKACRCVGVPVFELSTAPSPLEAVERKRKAKLAAQEDAATQAANDDPLSAFQKDAADEPGGRVVILGGPREGKTTLANQLARPRHTDDLIGKLDWSAASAEVATWFDEPGPWTVEGVATARALRKWLRAHPEGAPCDVVLVFGTAREKRSPGQVSMAAGVHKVWREIRAEVERRGALVFEVR